MNLRCTYCQTPFALGRMEKLAAIRRMRNENLPYYNALCPRCKRVNPISLQRLQRFTPGWQEGLKELEAQTDLTTPAAEPASPAGSILPDGDSSADPQPAAPTPAPSTSPTDTPPDPTSPASRPADQRASRQ